MHASAGREKDICRERQRQCRHTENSEIGAHLGHTGVNCGFRACASKAVRVEGRGVWGGRPLSCKIQVPCASYASVRIERFTAVQLMEKVDRSAIFGT